MMRIKFKSYTAQNLPPSEPKQWLDPCLSDCISTFQQLHPLYLLAGEEERLCTHAFPSCGQMDPQSK